MKFGTQKITFGIFLLLSILCFLPLFPIIAQTIDSVDTVVKIAICGNLIIEKPAEECEGLDLDGESCESLGFQSGVLSCDISCDFETALCVPFPPPACGDGTLDAGEECEVGNPIGSSCEWSNCNETTCKCEEEPEEPEPEEEEEEDDDDDDTPALLEELFIGPGDAPAFVSILPDALVYFDLNGDGIIQESEIGPAVELWVNIWRNVLYDEDEVTCDLNNDGKCDIYDFSILMYYIGK